MIGEVINPLKGQTGYGWHFEQQVYDAEGVTRALKAGGGSGNIPKVIEPCALDEQNQYIRTDGCVGTIMTDGSSPKHNNRVIEPVNTMPDGTCRTIKNQYYKTSQANFERSSTFGATGATDGFRIRKLTPKECFRLMGFDDSDVDLLVANKISNTQLYKMAGNSIVVNVLEFLFCQIFDNENEIWV